MTLTSRLYVSCEACKGKCCKTGYPTEHDKVSVWEWLDRDPKKVYYPAACEHLDLTTYKCQIWPNAPLICQTYICGHKAFTPEDVERIEKLIRSYDD